MLSREHLRRVAGGCADGTIGSAIGGLYGVVDGVLSAEQIAHGAVPEHAAGRAVLSRLDGEVAEHRDRCDTSGLRRTRGAVAHAAVP